MVKVYAPASSANMSVGFDVLGAAVTPLTARCWAMWYPLKQRTISVCITRGDLPINCRRSRVKILFISAGNVLRALEKPSRGDDAGKNMPIGSG